MGGKNTHIRKRSLRERGQALVEFAFVVPIFLVLLLGIIDFSMGLRAWITITNSAREGARVGAVQADCDTIIQRTVHTSADLLTADDVLVENCQGDPGDSVVVTVAYDYEFITPIGSLVSSLSGGPLHMESSADMRLE